MTAKPTVVRARSGRGPSASSVHRTPSHATEHPPPTIWRPMIIVTVAEGRPRSSSVPCHRGTFSAIGEPGRTIAPVTFPVRSVRGRVPCRCCCLGMSQERRIIISGAVASGGAHCLGSRIIVVVFVREPILGLGSLTSSNRPSRHLTAKSTRPYGDVRSRKKKSAKRIS